MALPMRNLIQRNGVYAVRVQLPADVRAAFGKTAEVRSLKTRNLNDALEDGRNYYRPDFDHNDFFEAIKDRPNWIQSNTDNQLVRDMYAGFRIESVEWKYGGSHTKG